MKKPPGAEDAALVYDDWYSRPKEPHWEDAPGKAVLIEALRKCCDRDACLRLLDVGCGTGSFLGRVALEVSDNWEAYGIDLSEAAIASGQRAFPGFQLETGDATRLAFPDARFDIVTCYGSWEHFPEPSTAIREAARVLVPGGWMFAMIPALGVHRTDRHDEGWYEDTEVAGCEQRQLQWNLRRSTWEEMFEDAGVQLAADSLARRCGAVKPGVFFFCYRLHGNGAATGGRRTTRTLRAASKVAADLSRGTVALIDAAAELLADRVAAGGKVLACGNGGSAADAQHFVAELVGRMTRERRAVPALALASDPSVVTALANDYGYERVFARQVEAFGQPGDVLLAISTSGRSPNVLAAVEAARGAGLATISLVGSSPDSRLAGSDIVIEVPSGDTQRVQEAHGVILHILCEAIESAVAGSSRPASPTENAATADY